MKPYSTKYAIPHGETEDRRQRKQRLCPHTSLTRFEKGDKWSLRCDACGKYVESDAHHAPAVRSDEILL